MMFSWLRDTLANTSSSLSYSHSMIPSHFFRQRQQQQQQQRQRHKPNHSFSPSDDDDATDDETNDHSFYHNPYHSSGLMNYTDVPQQQYVNEHNYPTFLAQQSTNQLDNQSIDEQIHQKLLSLQQRGNRIQTYAQRQYNYLNRTSSKIDLNSKSIMKLTPRRKQMKIPPTIFLKLIVILIHFIPANIPNTMMNISI